MNGLTKFLRSWRRYNNSMRELNRLGDRELADIGVSRGVGHYGSVQRYGPSSRHKHGEHRRHAERCDAML